MRLFIGFLVLIFICMSAHAVEVEHIMIDIPVNGTASVPSDMVEITDKYHFGIWLQAVSASGTPDIDVWVETCPYPPSGISDFVKPPRMSLLYDDLTLETVQQDTVTPPPTKFLIIRVKGNAGNPADTVLNIYFIKL